MRVACIKKRWFRPSLVMVATNEKDHEVFLARKIKLLGRPNDHRITMVFRDAETKKDRGFILDTCAYMRWRPWQRRN